MTEMLMSEYMFSGSRYSVSLLRMRQMYTQLYKQERLKAYTEQCERSAIKKKTKRKQKHMTNVIFHADVVSNSGKFKFIRY